MEGYWVKGDTVYDLTTSKHINFIRENPEAFGYTKEELNAIYAKHGEKIGTEGKAREEIIKEVSKMGWLRVRKYRRPEYWSIQFDNHRRRKKAINNFIEWAMLDSKVMHQYDEIVLIGYDDGYHERKDANTLLTEIRKSKHNPVAMTLIEHHMGVR